MKCSGIRCVMQSGTVDPGNCPVENCPNFTPEKKTADEMFQELGYEKVESGYKAEYRKVEPNGNKIRICVAIGENVSMTCEGKAFWMIADEIRAVCKLLDEMGLSDE